MPGTRSTPEQIAQVIALREAGYASASICSKTGLSPATVTRITGRYAAKKGSVKTELIEAARQHIVEELTSDTMIRDRIKQLVLDNIGHSELCRDKMLEALSYLKPSDTESAAIVIRACTSYATAVKASTDAVRPLLRDLEDDDDNAALPELIIRRMTDQDVAALREAQANEAEAMGLNNPDEVSEVEEVVSCE